MPITFPTDGPLKQVHDKLWELLEASSQFTNLVKPAGRIKFDAAEPAPPADNSVETTPRLIIEPAGLVRGEPAGSVLHYVQIFRLVLITEDGRVGPPARIKFVVAAALEAAGPGLGLAFVSGWTIAASDEDPDSTDRRPRGPDRRTVLTLRVRVRPQRADALTWLGSWTGPAGKRLRLFVNQAAIGDELAGFRTRVEHVGCAIAYRAEFRIAVAAADAVALDALATAWGRLAGCGAPGATVELREHDTGLVRVAFTRVRMAPPAAPMPEPDDMGNVRVVEWAGRTFDEPVIATGTAAISSGSRCGVDAAAGVVAPQRCGVDPIAALAAAQGLGEQW